MGDFDHSRSAVVDRLTEEIQLLIHVCRMIAGKSKDPDMADELAELADSLDCKVDQLRMAIAGMAG